MNKHKRWIKSLIDTAKAKTPALPWQRGPGRNAAIQRRSTRTGKPTLRRA